MVAHKCSARGSVRQFLLLASTKFCTSAIFRIQQKVYSVQNFTRSAVCDLIAADAVSGELSKSVAVLVSISDTPLAAFRKLPVKELAFIIAASGDLLGAVVRDPAVNEALAETGI